jgi:hypothetical protein
VEQTMQVAWKIRVVLEVQAKKMVQMCFAVE